MTTTTTAVNAELLQFLANALEKADSALSKARDARLSSDAKNEVVGASAAVWDAIHVLRSEFGITGDLA